MSGEAKQLLNQLIDIPVQVVRATVKSVDTDNWLAEVETVEGGGLRYDVRLRVIGDGSGKGVVVKPKDGSEVLIGIVENNKSVCYLAQYSEIDLLRIEIGSDIFIEIPENGNVKIKAKEILFDGTISGLIDTANLVSRLNAIETDINTLKTLFHGWTPSTAPGENAASLKTLIGAAWETDPLDLTTNSDIQTDTIEWP